LKKNISETKKIWQGKNVRKELSKGENCQEDLQQKNFLDGPTKDMTRNTGED